VALSMIGFFGTTFLAPRELGGLGLLCLPGVPLGLLWSIFAYNALKSQGK